MLGFYNYTVILTYCGLLISFLGMGFAIEGNMTAAFLCLMASGLCDMFDGKVASTRERNAGEKHFGIEIDSLSDIVCFGVFPAIILHMQQPHRLLAIICGSLYLLCALIRLAYFNVDEAQRQQQTEHRRSEYQGLPVSTCPIIIPLVYAIDSHFNTLMLVTPLTMVLLGIAFLTPFPLKKPHLPGMLLLISLGLCELLLILRGAF